MKPLLPALCVALACAPAWAQETVNDPVMGFNRAMYQFNDGVDKAALKPIAKGYNAAVPMPARVAFRNFIDNFADVPNALNNLLQGKVQASFSDLGRVLVNTTLGIAGTIDVASEMGLEKHQEDFGQTLGVWGVGTGPYLVLPLYGPSTLRDTAALPVDYATAGRHVVIESVAVRNSLTGLDVVDRRASLLGAEEALDQAALDPYVFVRNFYLQRRESLVRDGQAKRPADERFDDEAPQSAPGETQ